MRIPAPNWVKPSPRAPRTTSTSPPRSAVIAKPTSATPLHSFAALPLTARQHLLVDLASLVEIAMEG
ncbi:MAG TPA: hypothetical protein VME46_14170 [Acidimicrobiales bacterium]|nr:hypothetical protein [Acidimicrobiales bacterium]